MSNLAILLLLLCLFLSVVVPVVYLLTRKIPKYSCSNNKCIKDMQGIYKHSDCDGHCAPLVKKYDCVDGKCESNPSGKYTTSDCDGECHSVQPKYSCKDKKCVQDPNGIYSTPNCDNVCGECSNEIQSSCKPGEQCVHGICIQPPAEDCWDPIKQTNLCPNGAPCIRKVCRECKYGNGDNECNKFPGRPRCDAFNDCVSLCKSDSDCIDPAKPVCNSSGSCVAK
jgi:hypothetical protein